MSDPTPYTVSYSFAGWQAVRPDEPLPAVEVDNEFANIATAIVDLVDAITSVRRADGALQNGVVSYDSLSADLKATLNAAEPRVTVADLSPSAFATQAQAEAGVATDKLMSPLTVTQALAAQRPFATQSQATTATNNTTISTPLRVKEALDVLRAYASQAQAEAGTENTTVMTPLRTAQALGALRTAVSGSASLTWGSIAAGASAEQSMTVNGVAANDRVVIGLPATLAAGLLVTAWVNGVNSVRVRLTNITGGAITPFSGAATTLNATCIRF